MPRSPCGDECVDDNVVAEMAEGRLRGAALEKVEKHLSGCAACRALVGLALGGDTELPAGTRVGRYEVIERIGAGAMGMVYAARDPSLDRKVALKLIRAEVT